MMEKTQPHLVDLFAAALKLPPEQWENFALFARDDDVQLRQTLIRLLDQHRQASRKGTLDAPIAAPEALSGQARDALATQPHSDDSPTAAARLGNPPSGSVGDYEIIEKIAQGGMGVVYKARQRKLNRVVALKMILKGQFAGSEDIQRFYREAEAAAQLDHPGIVPIYEIGEHQGHHFYSMAYVPGSSLAKKVKSGPLLQREAAALVAKIARAIHYAHQQGIVHRDLKPHNVLVDDHGQPKVADFGLAKRIQGDCGLTVTGAALGTPAYMPPEQAAGSHEVGPTADVYSLGAILYRLVIGRPPFHTASIAETLRQVVSAEPPAPRALDPSIDRDVETICLKCLEKKPEHRYGSAAALADDLERYLAGLTIAARPVPQTVRAWRWCKRNKMLAGLLASLVLVSWVSLFLGVAWRQRAAESDTNAKIADTRAREARRQLYANDMARASESLELGNIARARSLLNAQWPRPDEEDFRGFEWRLLWRLVKSEATAFQGHVGIVGRAIFSPDGALVASAGFDKTVRLWRSSDGRPVAVLTGHREAVYALAFSPDGGILASVGGDRTIKFWDVARQKLLHSLECHQSPVLTIAFSADGRWAASGGDTDCLIHLIDVKSFRATRRFMGHSGQIRSVCFLDGGKKLASTSQDKTVRIWNTETGECLHVLHGHESVVQACAPSPDGSLLATCSWDMTVRFWDTNTWQPKGILRGHPGIVRSIAFSPDGRTLASTGQGDFIQLWDAKTLTRLPSPEGLRGMGWSIAFSSDGNRLISCSEESDRLGDESTLLDGPIKIWDATTKTQVRPQPPWLERASLTWETDDWIHDVRVAPDNSFIAAAQGNNLVVFDPKRPDQGKILPGHQGSVLAVALSPDGRTLASGGNDAELLLWNTKSRTLFKRLPLPNKHLRDLEFTANGKAIFVGDGIGMGWLVDIASSELLRKFPGRGAGIGDLAVSSDGKRLAAAREDGLVVLWNVQTGLEQWRVSAHHDAAHAVAFAPDGGTLATAGSDHVIRFWKIGSTKPTAELRGHLGQVRVLAFSPDGERLFSGGDDHTVRVWDVATRHELITLRGHIDSVRDLALSRDATWLVAGALASRGHNMGQVIAWRAPTTSALLRDCQQTAQSNWSDTDRQIAFVLCCLSLAGRRKASADLSHASRKAWLLQGRDVLRRLERENRLTSDQKEWMTAFEVVLAQTY